MADLPDVKTNVAYGALDMAHGKDIQEAFEHIDSLKDIEPVAWFFDLVHTPNQKDRAVEWGYEIIDYIHSAYPDLSDSNISVFRNSTAEKFLKGRNVMHKIIFESGTENVEYPDQTKQENKS